MTHLVLALAHVWLALDDLNVLNAMISTAVGLDIENELGPPSKKLPREVGEVRPVPHARIVRQIDRRPPLGFHSARHEAEAAAARPIPDRIHRVCSDRLIRSLLRRLAHHKATSGAAAFGQLGPRLSVKSGLLPIRTKELSAKLIGARLLLEHHEDD